MPASELDASSCRREFGLNATGVKNAFIGGWQVNGIVTWQRGFPLTIQADDLGGLNDTFGANRADRHRRRSLRFAPPTPP